MNLIYKNKTLSYDDKRAIEDLKRDMIREQGNRCYVCHEPFNSDRLPQYSHIISKADRNIKKYGYEVIHHRLNIPVCCPDCNSSVMINTSKAELIKEHLKPIYADLKSKGFNINTNN